MSYNLDIGYGRVDCMENNANNTKKIIIINAVLVGLILIGIIIVLITNVGGQKSSINTEEKVFAYINKQYSGDDFRIIEVNNRDVRGGYSAKDCYYENGYEYIVESTKTKVRFEVFDTMIFENGQCLLRVGNNYSIRVYNDIKSNYAFAKDEHGSVIYTVHVSDFDSKEKFADYLYEIFDKYLMKHNNYEFSFEIEYEGRYIKINPKNIDSKDDILELVN